VTSGGSPSSASVG